MKFKDADLIGIPLRVVVGERGLKDGTIETKWRNQSEAQAHPGGNGRRDDPRRARGGSAAARCVLPRAASRPARPRGGHEQASSRLPRLPYVLLGAMTLVSFGGPFVILGALRGGAERQLAARPACRMGCRHSWFSAW